VSGTIAGRFTKPDKEGNRVPWISCDDAGEKCFRAPAGDLVWIDPDAKPPAKKRNRRPANKVVADLNAAVAAGIKSV